MDRITKLELFHCQLLEGYQSAGDTKP